MKSRVAAVSFAAVLLLATACGGEGEQPGITQGKIAFRSESEGNPEIYVMNADGTGQMRLTNSPTWDAGPSWSPDGTRIAFESQRDGGYRIYVMNADGTSQTRLTGETTGYPVWMESRWPATRSPI